MVRAPTYLEEVPDWFRAAVLKTSRRASRIRPLPPKPIENANVFDFYDLYAQSGAQTILIALAVGTALYVALRLTLRSFFARHLSSA
jgi:hypothetical protein